MNLKQEAARRAMDFVRDGMVLGLGSGSTAGFFLEMLGKRLQSGDLQGIQGVPTSQKTAAHARDLGIPLTDLAEHSRLDLVVDGADEVDPQLDLIKGLGHALLREKILEIHAARFLVIVDESKLVERLGTRGPLPVEVVQFQVEAHVRWLGSLGCRAQLLREEGGSPFVTDNGNYLVHCRFPAGIADPYDLAHRLEGRPGIVEHGLFLDMASMVIVASTAGTRILTRGR
jgi:ribose 5-phosphate isomerase A